MKRYIRKNILGLAPYSTARDEYKGDIGVFLDANENPYHSDLNRYPDPYQLKLKKRIAEIKCVEVENVFLGNGSDEPIDLLFRVFCEPKEDNVVVIIPSYGMYAVSASINNVEVITVRLDDNFDITCDALLSAANNSTKMIMLCSPNNPSGNLLNKEQLVKTIESFDGVVVIDEAYIDFANDKGFLPFLNKYKNLVVLQTLSKAWGMAGVRLGMAFGSKEVVDVMTNVKYPYNIGVHTQELVLNQLEDTSRVEQQISEIISQRVLMADELAKHSFVRRVYPSDSNFILVEVKEPHRLYDYLINEELIVRDRSGVVGCNNALRITIGTPKENQKLINLIKKYI